MQSLWKIAHYQYAKSSKTNDGANNFFKRGGGREIIVPTFLYGTKIILSNI